MLTLITRLLAAAIVIAAVAAPTAAYAQVNERPVGVMAIPVEPPFTAGTLHTPETGAPAGASSSGFQWGDAGIGAGSLLVLLGVGMGAAVAIRRRTGGPVAG